MNKQYIEKVDDVYRIAGTRVWLDSIVYTFWRGQIAESIAQSFPVLTLEHVSGALTFYLANKSHIDSYLKKNQLDSSPRNQVLAFWLSRSIFRLPQW
jgi:uncharacterized protein (DUF433 family)